MLSLSLSLMTLEWLVHSLLNQFRTWTQQPMSSMSVMLFLCWMFKNFSSAWQVGWKESSKKRWGQTKRVAARCWIRLFCGLWAIDSIRFQRDANNNPFVDPYALPLVLPHELVKTMTSNFFCKMLDTYLPIHRTYFYTEWVTKVKPDVILVKVHPMDGALVGAGSLWPKLFPFGLSHLAHRWLWSHLSLLRAKYLLATTAGLHRSGVPHNTLMMLQYRLVRPNLNFQAHVKRRSTAL